MAKAIVLGASGLPHRVFLIHAGYVRKEWDVDDYLAMSRLDTSIQKTL